MGVDREDLRKLLQHSLDHLDDLNVAMVMINGIAVWTGDPYWLLGWLRYITITMERQLLLNQNVSGSLANINNNMQ